MKHLLLACACLLISGAALMAQTAEPYNVSVFNSRTSGRADINYVAQTLQKVQKNFPGWNAETEWLNGTFKDIYGPGLLFPGTDINEKLQYCIENKLNDLEVHISDWKQTRNSTLQNGTFVDYVQSFSGHDVVFSRLSFRFTPQGKLVRVQMKNYGKPSATLVPVLTATDAKTAAVKDLSAITVTSVEIANDWVWFPIPGNSGYTIHPAWSFTVYASTQNSLPIKLTGYLDAIDGKILYRQNEVKDIFDLTVNASVFKDGTTSPATLQPLTDLLVTVGSTNLYTDTAGYTNSSSISLPATANVNLEGKWSKVVDNPTGITPTVSASISATGTIYTFAPSGTATERHINAYYHVNRVHNFMKGYYPTFTGMDIQLPTNVDLTSGTCNAFYSGSSINFYAAGGGCMSFADIGSVVYHEYGHGISDKYYNMVKGGGTINDGGLNEGNSDVWAMCVTHNPVVGAGAYTGSTGYIRRYDGTPSVYPKDLTGESHANGQIIAGAWWDVGTNIGSYDSMARLFTSTYNDAPDGPNGTEGDIYHAVLISALINDDTDGNINNGTPHFAQIVKAFARHGIFLLSDAVLTHSELKHQPAGIDIDVNASLTVTYPFFLQGIKLVYKPRGVTKWDTLAMINTSGSNYTAQIPAQTAGKIIDYYLSINDTLNQTDAYSPSTYDPTVTPKQTSIPYQFGVGIGVRDSNTFESDITGWSVGNNAGDNATGGIWIWAVPVRSMSNGLVCQTGADHTSGTGKCLVTGNAVSPSSLIGTADVDNGKTTILSPVFDLSGYINPIIEYYRWYGDDMSTNPKEDLWDVQIVGGTSTLWKDVDATYQSDYNWRRRIFALSEYITTSRKNIQLKFIAQDPVETGLPNNGQSVVEAAVDDFFIYDLGGEDVPQTVVQKASIYPNPANDLIKVVMPASNNNGNIGLYDLTGKKISATDLQNNISQYELDTKNLASGSYMLIIQSGKSIQSQKIVVQH